MSVRRHTGVYEHHYGGLGQDMFVTLEGFARFFGVSKELVESLPVNMKAFDVSAKDSEMIGYVLQGMGCHHPVPRKNAKGRCNRHPFSRGEKAYRITVVTYHWHDRYDQLLGQLHNRDEAPPHGIPRPLYVVPS